ncbi:hypothetical protein [Oceanicoccus sagamiensis]|uniref:PEP-CTERM sorting domain-containing protein n=1 Tax=Oceanicoccus sagamiensis TaxID=716816 RepID=A0A1X9N3P8_9GAMM|nr:hypothetical protein [Oceanicoccus sagamiensis]ARN72810.1 hypothetical protein BST96_01000 [Oceanicoccus sagamiensis]
MRLLRKIGLLALVVSSYSNSVQAETFNFSCITNNIDNDCQIGEDQIIVDILDGGVGYVDFKFTNLGPAQSTISEIYFDDGTLLGLTDIATSSGGVKFSPGAKPPDLPGGNTIGFEVTAGFLADADNPAPKKGVNVNEWVTITFELINGKTYDDTIAAMGTELLIGVHVTNFGSGGSESLVAPAAGISEVPVPGAAWLFGSALLGLAGATRKRA